MIEIRGKVTDFDGNPLENADVVLKDKKFGDVYKNLSDADGKYHLQVIEGTYIALFACKDYSVRNLEFWAWNVPAFQDLEINPRFDGLELYAMNAWIPQGAYPSLQVYVRPMSLQRVRDKGGPEAFKSERVIDIAPKLKKDDVSVKIDDQNANVLDINEVREAVGSNQSMRAYIIQTVLPDKWKDLAYHQILMTLRDSVTAEKGEGIVFWKTPCWK